MEVRPRTGLDYGLKRMTVKRPVLRYFGSKWRLAPWIISHFPEHNCYVEPYGGGGSVLLRKPAAPLEVYNDLDSEVVTFFRVLRDRPEELQRVLDATPYSFEEYKQSFDMPTDDIEIARRFMIRMWQGYAGVSGRRTGWKRQNRQWGSSRCMVLERWNKARDIANAVERFQTVQIEHRDALKVIQSFDGPETLFYLDPPYPKETRSHRWDKAYKCELDIDDHVHLLNFIKKIKGAVVLSSYPNGIYDEELKDWRRVEKDVNTISHAKKATEVLYIKNPD